jgi:50S ribosomal subunit-associated GTPase HflX
VRAAYAGAFELSARSGDGIDDVLRAVAERLALDVQRYTLTFAPGPDVAARIARLYKHARVVSHQDDGRQTVVEVDVPRRVAAWLVEPMVTA